jgi:hypothetical protein
MIHAEAAPAHHLFEVTVTERIPAVPTDAQKDEGGLEVAPLERGLMLLHEVISAE